MLLLVYFYSTLTKPIKGHLSFLYKSKFISIQQIKLVWDVPCSVWRVTMRKPNNKLVETRLMLLHKIKKSQICAQRKESRPVCHPYVALYQPLDMCKKMRQSRGNRRRVSASYLPIYSQNVYHVFIFVYKSVLPPCQFKVTDPVVFV